MILNVDFDLTNEQEFKRLQEMYNDIGQEALYLNHYELSERTDEPPYIWREFITDPRVSTAIDSEMDLLKKSKVALMLKDIEETRSTGQAQLLSTLLNQTKKDNKRKEGPVFIYSFIPPNAQEMGSPNVRVLDVDPFKVSGE